MKLLPLVALVACTVTEPSGSVVVTPPPHFARWYEQTWRDCGSRERLVPEVPYTSLTFYRVPGVDFTMGTHPGRYAGYWQGNRIYIAEYYWDQALVLKHEFLHAQLGSGVHLPIFSECGLA